MANPAYTYKMDTARRDERNKMEEYSLTNCLRNNPLCLYIAFLVEQTLFTLPRHCFEHGSELFRDLFTLPRVQGQPPDGSSKERPLRLDGIMKADFIPFITVLCQEVYETLTWTAWLSVLKLADMWDFRTVRKIAIREMLKMKMSPVDRILAARALDIREWYWPALLQLSEMQDSPDGEDVQRLGFNFVKRVYHLQGFRKGLQDSNYRYKHTSSMYVKLTEDHFREYFPEELKGIPLAQCSEEVQALCEKIRAPVIKNVYPRASGGSACPEVAITQSPWKATTNPKRTSGKCIVMR